MPRPYPPEFRARAVALVRAGKQVKQTAHELGISAGCLHGWVHQDRIDRGERPGVSTSESDELRAARKRIGELERELAIVRHAATFLDPTAGPGRTQKDPPGDRRARCSRDTG